MLIKVSIDHKVATIKLARPEKRNALSIELMQKFIQEFKKLDQDEKIQVIVIEGEGVCFCSGLDLTEAIDRVKIDESANLIRDLLLIVYSSNKITIASVHGAALAGGAGLMSVCDVVVADKNSRMGFPELKRGLVPAFIMVFLKRKINEGTLREMVIMAKIIDAQEAKNIGLVHYVVEKDHDSFLQKLIEESLMSAPGAVIHTKNLLEILHARKLVDELKVAEKTHRLSRDSSESAEGIAAFLDKREPEWN